MKQLNETGVAGTLFLDLVILMLVLALVMLQPQTGVGW